MITPSLWPFRRTRSLAQAHVSDMQLSDMLDDCIVGDQRAIIDAHLADCAACAGRKRGMEAVIALAALERATTRVSPDQWLVIAACTVHERRLERYFARRARRRMRGWIIAAVLSSILLFEGLRQASVLIARSGAWVAAKAWAYSR